ncbi:MAG: hypothetical protein KC912_12140 [Proteobacteria bacterium]|nr:hypothetical protein [Pseudomonadota bacterium]
MTRARVHTRPILASLLALTLFGCGAPRENWAEGNCDDGLDNDLDGLLDCEEAECGFAEVCGGESSLDTGFSSATASGATTQWVLDGFTFNDGGTGKGFFVYDASMDQITTWSLCVTAGPQFPAMVYDSTTSHAAWNDYHDAYSFSGTAIVGPYSNSYRILRIRTSAVEPAAAQPDDSRLVSGVECVNCAPLRTITSGEMVAVSEGQLPSSCEDMP